MDYINWFPGHMAKAMKEIKEKQSLIDCFIVLIDSRVPLSSYNDEFDSIAPNKPRLFVFSKSDYTNEQKVKKTFSKYNDQRDKCILVNLKQNSSKNLILRSLNQLLLSKREKDKQKGLLKPRLRVFVIGMPNVGKSTLINLLANSRKTKIANFAGTTRSLQWISAGDIQLLDTPGILMPKLMDQQNALKLVACGLIKQDVINDKEFYYQIVDILNNEAPYKFSELDIEYQEDENGKYSELVKYARKYNYVIKNNEVDINKVLTVLRKKILDFKDICWD